jgi:hypothetical protein
LVQSLTDLTPERILEIKEAFFAQDREQDQAPAKEMFQKIRDKICGMLGIQPGDCWNFEEAEKQITDICAKGDEELSYIVDLKDAGGSDVRGLEVLQHLSANKSLGTAFILTHETTAERESETETALRAQILRSGDGQGVPPLCVISNERLQPEDGDEATIQDALKVAVKRAGLRRAMHDVLGKAKGRLETAYSEAVEVLLSVPPEHLEAHVVERGRKEGVSELHVIERAITAHIGQQVRDFFGRDPSVRKSTARLRALQGIPLNAPPIAADSVLAPFRKAEIWEEDSLLNASLTPLACGDVFEADPFESEIADQAQAGNADGDGGDGKDAKLFVLLGQPCDLALRSNGTRDASTAFLVPLKKKQPLNMGEKANSKEVPLPFVLDGQIWLCDFRKSTPVKLAILDFATFRTDGRVRADTGHTPSDELLPGQRAIYNKRAVLVDKALRKAKPLGATGDIAPSLQLTFSNNAPFQSIHFAAFKPATDAVAGENGERPALPGRVTWGLRRSGRIRMPYAAAVLDHYVSAMNRHAFDLDYMNPGISEEANGELA